MGILKMCDFMVELLLHYDPVQILDELFAVELVLVDRVLGRLFPKGFKGSSLITTRGQPHTVIVSQNASGIISTW